MASLPEKPAGDLPPLALGWTEHKAPSGHLYYYNKDTKISTYARPVAIVQSFPNPFAELPTVPFNPPPGASFPANAFQAFPEHNQFDGNIHPERFNNLQRGSLENHGHERGGSSHHRGGHRGGHNDFAGRRRQPQDRPKHRYNIPNCAPWVLVKTKLGRRFVWNTDTNESFWNFPVDVLKGVVEFDRLEREKRERRERGEPDEDEILMAEIEAELEAAQEQLEDEMVEVDGDEGMENEEEYEVIEVTDDEGEEEAENSAKRQRTEEPQVQQDENMEMGEDDMAWQLAAMEEQYEDEEEGLPLTEEDCKALFKELLDDTGINPYTPWDKIIDDGILFDDERYKALGSMKARKDCFDEWGRDKMQVLKEQKAKQQKLDPRIPYLGLLHRLATPKLYWPEFRRKYRKEPEMKDIKLPDKEKENLYRDHIKRLGLKPSELKSDLSALLKAQTLSSLNQSSTLNTLPTPILTDLRFISLPASTRDSLLETYISTLPPAPDNAAASAEEEAEAARRRAERERRERALADRERRVREEKRRQERELAYGKGRLREEEMEIERAMKIGKDGLKTQLGSFVGDGQVREAPSGE